MTLCLVPSAPSARLLVKSACSRVGASLGIRRGLGAPRVSWDRTFGVFRGTSRLLGTQPGSLGAPRVSWDGPWPFLGASRASWAPNLDAWFGSPFRRLHHMCDPIVWTDAAGGRGAEEGNEGSGRGRWSCLVVTSGRERKRTVDVNGRRGRKRTLGCLVVTSGRERTLPVAADGRGRSERRTWTGVNAGRVWSRTLGANELERWARTAA